MLIKDNKLVRGNYTYITVPIFPLVIWQDILQHRRTPRAPIPVADRGDQTLPQWIRTPPAMLVQLTNRPQWLMLMTIFTS